MAGNEEVYIEQEDMLDLWNDENVAFIKYDTYEGNKMWVIYGSDGYRLAAASDRDFAFIMARQNDLDPCSVH